MKKTIKNKKQNKCRKYRKYKKYFVKDASGLSVIDFSYFESVESWIEAFSIGICCYSELQRVLKEDAIDGDDSFIGTMKVTTGLERTLQELDARYPQLLKEIHSAPLTINGSRVIRC